MKKYVNKCTDCPFRQYGVKGSLNYIHCNVLEEVVLVGHNGIDDFEDRDIPSICPVLKGDEITITTQR